MLLVSQLPRENTDIVSVTPSSFTTRRLSPVLGLSSDVTLGLVLLEMKWDPRGGRECFLPYAMLESRKVPSRVGHQPCSCSHHAPAPTSSFYQVLGLGDQRRKLGEASHMGLLVLPLVFTPASFQAS